MGKKKEVKKEKKEFELGDIFYKGYDIKWLREKPEHPDFGLVAEFDKKIKVLKVAEAKKAKKK